MSIQNIIFSTSELV